MKDIELIELCAIAMGYDPKYFINRTWGIQLRTANMVLVDYNPIKDDAQVMALAKRYGLEVDFARLTARVPLSLGAYPPPNHTLTRYKAQSSISINYAIITCIAQMQKANS